MTILPNASRIKAQFFMAHFGARTARNKKAFLENQKNICRMLNVQPRTGEDKCPSATIKISRRIQRGFSATHLKRPASFPWKLSRRKPDALYLNKLWLLTFSYSIRRFLCLPSRDKFLL